MRLFQDIMGRKAKGWGDGPEVEYYYTIVAVWLDEDILFCALVSTSGQTNVLQFTALALAPLS